MIANLGSTYIPYMNYPIFQFSKHWHFSQRKMAIVKFVSLVPLMTQVVETHTDTRKSLRTKSKYYTSQRNNVWKLLEQISDHFSVSICVSFTCAISGTNGTNLTITTTPLGKVSMLRKLEYRVIHVCRSRFCNQVYW